MPITYRMIRMDDAEAFWHTLHMLDEESPYMLYEPGERVKNLGTVNSRIFQVENGSDFLMLAVDGGEIAGFVSAERGHCQRIRRTAYIAAGIRQAYCDQGIGTALLRRLDQWAQNQGIIRLELEVMSSNDRAIHLYRKCGYRIEGRKEKSVYSGGKYTDELFMAKIFSRHDCP